MGVFRKFAGAISVSLIVAGCGGYDSAGISDDNTAEARRYEIIQALDEGNYDFVIQALENDPTYGGAFTEEEGRLNLAAAYVGRAGFDINDVVNSMIDSEDDQDAFTTFIQALSENIGSRGSLWLSRASDIYQELAGGNCDNPQTDIQRDACFYKAVVDTTTAAVTVATLVEDVNTWLNPTGCDQDANQNGIGDEADATACAISYAASGSCSIRSVNYRTINPRLEFTNSAGNSYTYELLEITISGQGQCSGTTNTEYRLIEGNSVAVTEGYCDINFNPCSTLDPSAGCYPCPVVDNQGNSLDVIETIVDTINNSDDIINQLVPADSDVQQAVNDFLQEVCGADLDCTQDEIADYLQTVQ